jgi:anion-transporting  ArsA/GET3 family ATPase
MTQPLHRELVFVTGKGGVGKTTVALSAAIAAARGGRRTILCEIAGQGRAARAHDLGAATPGAEVALGERLWATTVDPRLALEEWAARQIGSRRLVHAMAGSNAFAAFLAAAPGARELLTIAKAWELARSQRWVRGARRCGSSSSACAATPARACSRCPSSRSRRSASTSSSCWPACSRSA